MLVPCPKKGITASRLNRAISYFIGKNKTACFATVLFTIPHNPNPLHTPAVAMLVSSWSTLNNPFNSRRYPQSSSSAYTQSPQRYPSSAWISADSSPVASTSNAIPKRDTPLESKTSIKPAAPMSCLDQSSTFFSVLTAPYRQPPAVRPELEEEPIDAHEVERCHSAVDWSRVPARPDSSDEEETTSMAPLPDYDHLERVIYEPHGQWAWSTGSSIEHPSILTHLGCEFPLTHIQCKC